MVVDRGVHAADAQFDGGVPGRGVHDRIGHEDGIDRAGTVGAEDARTVGLDVRGPEGGSEQDADPVPVRFVHDDSRVLQGQPRRCRRHLGEPVHPPQRLERDEVSGAETLHLRPQM